MSDEIIIPELAGYVPVKEAAKMLGVQERRIHRYIETGKLKAVRAGNVYVIPVEEVQLFQRQLSGRPRKNTPAWHLAVGKSVWLQIFVRLRPGSEAALERRLEAMREGGTHVFPGTTARFIALSDQRPDEVQILLVWRGARIPNSEEREADLAALRAELAEIVDWETARYETSHVLMHT